MDVRPYVTLSVPSHGVQDLANPLAAVEVQVLQGAEIDCDVEIAPWFHLTADMQVDDHATVRANPAAPRISFGFSDRAW